MFWILFVCSRFSAMVALYGSLLIIQDPKWDFFCEFLSDQHMKVLNNATSQLITQIFFHFYRLKWMMNFKCLQHLRASNPCLWNLTSLFSTYRQIYCSNIDTYFSNIYTSSEYQKINRFALERLSIIKFCHENPFRLWFSSHSTTSLFTQIARMFSPHSSAFIEEVSENHKNRKYTQPCCCRKHQKKADISSRSEIRLRLNWQTDTRQNLESCTDYTSDHILR